MPAPALRRPERHARRLRFCAVVSLAVARQVIEEASRWLGEPLPEAWARALALRAGVAARHTRGWAEKLARPGDEGREQLYVFLRHWLSARLLAERPDLFARLPKAYALGHALPAAAPASLAVPTSRPGPVAPPVPIDRSPWLSPDARLLLAI